MDECNSEPPSRRYPWSRVNECNSQQQTADQEMDIPVPPAMEERAAVPPQERDQVQIAVQKVDIQVPPVMEERVAVVHREADCVSSACYQAEREFRRDL